MSRLFVLTRPQLARGFQLAGADSYGAEDIESAESYVSNLLENGESGLLAIDDGLLARMDVTLLKRLEQAEDLYYIVIPGGEPLGEAYSREVRIAELIRRTVGVHISLKSLESRSET